MSIQVNSGVSNINWEALLGKIGDVQKTTAANGKESITLTVKVGEGGEVMTFGIPDDLDLPETIDQAAIDSLCEKLAANGTDIGISDADIAVVKEKLTVALADIGGAVKKDSKSVMFDLYKLMALLVEVAQKQRDAAREMRKAESEQVQVSIQNQADAQRTAAWTGLIAGAICCAIQVVVTGVSLYKQSKAYSAQSETVGASGLNSAKDGAAMLKTANTPEAAAKQLGNVQAKIGDSPSGVEGKTVQQAVNDSFENSENAGMKLASAKSELESTIRQRQQVEQLNADVDNLEVDDIPEGNDPDLQKVKTSLAALKAQRELVNQGVSQENIDDYISKRQNFDHLPIKERVSLMEMEKQHGDMLKPLGDRTSTQLKADIRNTLSAKVDQLRTAEVNGKAAVETARVEYRNAIKGDITRYENEFEIARHDVDNITKDTPKAEADATRAKFTAAENKLKFARAKGFDKLAQPGITTENEYFQDVRDATDKVTLVDNARQNTTEYKNAQRTIDRTNTAISITNMVGNSFQSMINSVTQMQQADATRMSADQKKSEEELDQAKDLFSQAQTLIDSAIQLMQAVAQAETQSMRDAIQA